MSRLDRLYFQTLTFFRATVAIIWVTMNIVKGQHQNQKSRQTESGQQLDHFEVTIAVRAKWRSENDTIQEVQPPKY